MNTRLWTPIQHGRFILRNKHKGESVRDFAIRCNPDVMSTDIKTWQRRYRLAVKEANRRAP